MESFLALQNILNGFLKFVGPLLWIARFLFLTIWGWILIVLSSLLVMFTNSFSREGRFSPMKFFGNTIQGLVQFYFSIASVIIGLILLLLLSFIYNLANDISKGISLYREIKMLEATLRNLKSERKIMELRAEYVQSGEVKMIKVMIQYYAHSPFQNKDVPSGYEEHLISGRKVYIGFGVINFDYSLIEKGEIKNIAFPDRLYSDSISYERGILLLFAKDSIPSTFRLDEKDILLLSIDDYKTQIQRIISAVTNQAEAKRLGVRTFYGEAFAITPSNKVYNFYSTGTGGIVMR